MPVHSRRVRSRWTPGFFATSRVRSRDRHGTVVYSAMLDHKHVTCSSGTPEFSLIVDHKCSRDPDGNLPQSEVDHIMFVKNSVVDQGPISYSFYNAGTGGTADTTWTFAGLPSFTTESSERWETWFPMPPSAELRSLGLAAFAQFNSQFPEEVSLANFTMELKDLPGMAADLIGKFASLRPGVMNGEWPRITPETVSGDFLSWNFGWAPFMGDLSKLAKVLDSVRRRLEHLRRTKGRAVKAGFLRPVDQSARDNEPLTIGFVAAGGIAFGGVRVFRTSLETTFRAGAHVRHDMDYLDEPEGMLRALIGTLGLTNPLKVAWNAMPFSFVADWLLDVGGFLNAYGVIQDQESGWVVSRLCWSLTQVGTFRAEVTPRGGNPITLGTWKVKRYRRFVGLPISPLDISSPTPQQIALLAALTTGSSRH